MSCFSIDLHFSTLICLRAVPSLYPFKKLACVANVVNPADDPRSIPVASLRYPRLPVHMTTLIRTCDMYALDLQTDLVILSTV